MKKTYNVILDEGTTLDYYNELLSRFNQWDVFNREIKLSSLLEEKRIQYDIVDITGYPIYGKLGNGNDVMLRDISFQVTDMSFVLNGNTIDELKVKLKILGTDAGEKLKSLINDGIDINIYQIIVHEKVFGFYVDFDTKLSA